MQHEKNIFNHLNRMSFLFKHNRGICSTTLRYETENDPEAISAIEYLEDGSYFITLIEEAKSDISFFSSSATKSKTAIYFNSNNVPLWSVTVTGTFTYGNGTSKCTHSSVSATSYNTSIWRIASTSSSFSGNTATATATAKQYQSNQLLRTVTKKVTLTCSATGKFS